MIAYATMEIQISCKYIKNPNSRLLLVYKLPSQCILYLDVGPAFLGFTKALMRNISDPFSVFAFTVMVLVT